MKKRVFKMFRGFMFGMLVLPMVACEGDIIKDKEEEGATEKDDIFVQAIDLGLSVKWAEHNVGATKPEEFGGYYAWGEIEVKDVYNDESYKYYDNAKEEFINIGSNISATAYDVAYVKWGKNWRMPTNKEIGELCNNCSWSWITVNGVSGYQVTGPNGNSIFLPAAGNCYDAEVYDSGSVGCYWSGTSYDEDDADYFAFEEGDWWWDDTERPCGFSVRPVTE